MIERQSLRVRFVLALGLSTLVSLAFYVYGSIDNHSLDYPYLPWNLLLAWIPLAVSLWLVRLLRRKLWSSWEAVAVSTLWLVFLPNSFYLVSDFIHLTELRRLNLLFDVAMFTSFVYTGLVLGFSSLYLVHRELRRRFSTRTTVACVELVLLACSFAIYLGRDLRWNTWDVLVNPAGLLFDVSDRLLHPLLYPQMFVSVGAFFVLLSSMYLVAWQLTRLFRQVDAA